MERVKLDVPPVVVFNGENWSVGKVNHLRGTINIWRNLRVKMGSYEYFDIEIKEVSASELYKADTNCIPLHEVPTINGR